MAKGVPDGTIGLLTELVGYRAVGKLAKCVANALGLHNSQCGEAGCRGQRGRGGQVQRGCIEEKVSLERSKWDNPC